jgi:hypothetical protein
MNLYEDSGQDASVWCCLIIVIDVRHLVLINQKTGLSKLEKGKGTWVNFEQYNICINPCLKFYLQILYINLERSTRYLLV